MYQPHGSLKCEISDSVQIWRYMDFTKFIDLLTWHSLWFARLDTLGDPFEGTYPAENHARFAEMAADADIDAQSAMGRNEMSEDDRDLQHSVISGTALWTTKANRRRTYVSCWHNNDNESAAMWRLYLKSDEGIAIRSTTRRLVESLAKCPERIFVSRVKYIDYKSDAIENDREVWNTLDGIIHKRVNFAHEEEIRAIIYKPELLRAIEGETMASVDRITPVGYTIGLDLATLIKSVYVSPMATDWFYNLVKTVSMRFGISAGINRSALGESPII